MVIKMGFKPGEQFGTVLRAVFQAQLDGNVQTHEEAMNFARELYTSDIRKEDFSAGSHDTP